MLFKNCCIILFIIILIFAQVLSTSNDDAPHWCDSMPPFRNPACKCMEFPHEVGRYSALECNVCAKETPTIKWLIGLKQKEMKPISKSNEIDANLRIDLSRKDLLANVTTSTEGTVYVECVAENRFGKYSLLWKLLWSADSRRGGQPGKISRIIAVTNGSAPLGGSAEIGCIISANDLHMDDTIWLRGNYSQLMLDSNFTSNPTASDIPYFAEAYPQYRVTNVADNTAKLNFKKVTKDQYGPYTCFFKSKSTHSAGVPWLLETPKEASSLAKIIGIAIAVVLFFVVVFVIIFVYLRKRYKPAFKPVEKRVIQTIRNDIYGIQDIDVRIELLGRSRNDDAPVSTSVVCSHYRLELDRRWEISPKKIALQKPLGDGINGHVVSGKLYDHFGEREQDVAVKMLRDGAVDDDLLQLVKELALLKQVGSNPNVIRFIGCCTQKAPIMVIVELARFGNLRDFLRNHRPPEPDYCIPSPMTPMRAGMTEQVNSPDSEINESSARIFETNLTLTYRHLVNFAQQVANGMEYLSFRGFIHRDLAARNVLVTDNYQLKISDFGLTRQVANPDVDYYRRLGAAMLPIKWMAPECLANSKYTTKSDVWSYGVLLWEIYSLGQGPYPEITGFEEMVNFIIHQNRRLPRPKYADNKMFDGLFKICWKTDPDERPSFQQIRLFLKNYNEFAPNVPLGSIPFQSPPLTPIKTPSVGLEKTLSAVKNSQLPRISDVSDDANALTAVAVGELAENDTSTRDSVPDDNSLSSAGVHLNTSQSSATTSSSAFKPNSHPHDGSALPLIAKPRPKVLSINSKSVHS